MKTLSKTDAKPCQKLSLSGTCDSTHIRYNDIHGWCASCGIKRDVAVTSFFRMTYEVTYTTTDTKEAHKYLMNAFSALGMTSIEQKKVEEL